jgi:hypothetical protein
MIQIWPAKLVYIMLFIIISPLLMETAVGQPADEPEANFDWNMPDRFGFDRDGNGIIDYHYSKNDLDPPLGYYFVSFDGCSSLGGSSPIISYTWTIKRDRLTTTIVENTCKMTSPVSLQEGPYLVTLTVGAQNGQTDTVTRTVVVKDIFIVSIGDSYASGEGNPDQPRPQERWENDNCHRSANAGPAQAALELERSDPHTSVTFVSFACTGATINEGLVGEYDKKKLPPQIWQVTNAICRVNTNQSDPVCLDNARKIDILLVSIGGNDIGFGDIVRLCFLSTFNPSAPSCADNLALRSAVDSNLDNLPSLYDKLAADIKKRFRVSNIYISEYPDATHNEQKEYCGGWPLDREESEWIYEDVLTRLNHEVYNAAKRHGWNYVAGIASQFYVHGYCASDDQRWFNTVRDSRRIQGGIDGTMHPNGHGQTAYKLTILGNILHGSFNDATNFPDGNMEVFSRGTSDHIYHLFTTAPGQWIPLGWMSLGHVPFAADPVAVALPGPNMEVFARGIDGNIYHLNTIAPGQWNPLGWQRMELGQLRDTRIQLVGDFSAIVFPDGNIEVFARANNNHLYHTFTIAPGQWNPDGWMSLGHIP